MNIDDLSKSQLLLLTLLVNFVMSIATGIVTVALLDEAPANITQTVNRIVEHTVETVVPATDTQQPVKTQPTEEDLLVSAIAGDKARTAYLYKEATTSPALAQGVYFAKSRAFVVLASKDLPENALVGFPDGSAAQVSISKRNETIVIYGFSDTSALPSAPATTLLGKDDLKQGQAVIGLTEGGSAVTGIISKITDAGIVTTLPQTPAGASAVTLRGELVGISTGVGSAYISAGAINELLSAPETPAGT